MKTLKTPAIKEKYNLDDSYRLINIDYRDCIESPKDIEKIIQCGNVDFMYEDTWLFDAEWETIHHYITEIEAKFGELSDEDQDLIVEYIKDNDDSDPINDLMKNTPSVYFYYSLGIEIENHDGHCSCEKGCEEGITNQIMKALRTKNTETKESVKEVVYNAGYGGSLVILFEDNVKDMIEKGNVIEFGPTAEICIMDRFNGSGWSAPLNTTIVAELDRNNLHCDEGAPGYSFTSDVRGLAKGFMGGACIRNKAKTDRLIKSQINEE